MSEVSLPAASLAAAVTLAHFSALLLFALLMSIAFAFLGRSSVRDRVRFALRCFLLFVGAALLLGWLMFPFSR